MLYGRIGFSLKSSCEYEQAPMTGVIAARCMAHSEEAASGLLFLMASDGLLS